MKNIINKIKNILFVYLMINICVIGCGPNGLYILNSLLCLKKFYFLKLKFKIYVFDNNGNFGSGWVHSFFQPQTSMLNRISSQLAYIPDFIKKFNFGFIRINFNEWCKCKFDFLKDNNYEINFDEFPIRKLYGNSLKEIFNLIIQEFFFYNILIFLLKQKILNILKNQLGYYIVICKKILLNINFTFICITTGHQEIKNNFFLSNKLLFIIYYMNFAYPLYNINFWKKSIITIIGMGLTAIDLILFYTENKLGKFLRINNKLFYRQSFNECKNLITLSRSGYFIYSRPYNFKEINLILLEHIGYFLKKKFIDILRFKLGKCISYLNFKNNKIKQIDFDIHLYPIIILELKLCYYRVLFGYELLSLIIFYLKFKLLILLNNKCFLNKNERLFNKLLSLNVDKIIFEIFFKIKILYKFFINYKIKHIFIKKIFVKFNKNKKNIFNYKFILKNIFFNLDFIINPINYIQNIKNINYKFQLIKFIEIDINYSEQGNINNAYKSCCDDVFRDLRQVLVYAIDLGGITPYSYYSMLLNFYSIHNRSANGNCIELMEKILSLILSKFLCIEYAKSNLEILNNKLYIQNINYFNLLNISILIDAKLHNFNIIKSKNNLFKNLIINKIGSIWIHSDNYKIKNNLFSFNLNKNFQILNIYEEKEFIFCLGQPSEGILFFQNGSIRPFVKHHIAYDLNFFLFKIQQELINL